MVTPKVKWRGKLPVALVVAVPVALAESLEPPAATGRATTRTTPSHHQSHHQRPTEPLHCYENWRWLEKQRGENCPKIGSNRGAVHCDYGNP